MVHQYIGMYLVGFTLYSKCPSVRVSVHICDILLILYLSPLYDVPDHTNHIFSESSSSGDDNDQDENLQEDKYKDTQTKTNTKCFQDPMYAIFIKSRGFKDLKYYIGSLLVMTKTKTRFYALLGLNIFQGSIFSRSEYFSVFQE